MLSIGVLTDQPILAAGLICVLSARSDYVVFSCGAKANDIYPALQQQPNVLLIDIDMPAIRPSFISDCLLVSPETNLVVFSSSTSVQLATRALEAGAVGCVLKSCTADELMQAIATVVDGGKYISPGFAGDLIAGLQRSVSETPPKRKVIFTVREDQIVNMLLVGLTNKQIAAGLRISERTVKHYMTILMQKLQARNRTEVVIAARNINIAHSQDDVTSSINQLRH